MVRIFTHSYRELGVHKQNWIPEQRRASLRQASLLVCLLCAFGWIFPAAAPAAMDENAFVRLCADAKPEAIRKALQEGANPNAKATSRRINKTRSIIFESESALLLVASEPEKAQILLDAGADVNAASRMGETPLMRAARACPVRRTLSGKLLFVEDEAGGPGSAG